MITQPDMNLIDTVALAVVGAGMLRGYWRGLSGELAQLIGLVSAFVLGLSVYRGVGEWLADRTRLEGRPAAIVAFLGTMAVAAGVMLLVRLVLRRVMKVVVEEKIDRPAGCIAGFLRATLFVVLVFVVMNLWPHEYLNAKFGEESAIGRLVVRLMPAMREGVEKIEEEREEWSEGR